MRTVHEQPNKVMILISSKHSYINYYERIYGWLGSTVVERRSLIGELSLVCTGPAADG